MLFSNIFVLILLSLDFERFFSEHNAKLSRYAKLEWTQLQFIFELKDGDVHTSYRAYASDDVIELLSKENFKIMKNGQIPNLPDVLAKRLYDMVPINTKIYTYTLPRKTVLRRNDSGILEIPHGVIPPAKFVPEKVDSDKKK